MRKIKITIVTVIISLLLANIIWACSTQISAMYNLQNKGCIMKLLIDNVEVEVDWEDNESVRQIISIASSSDIIINAHRYGGFEQVGELGHNIVSNDVHMTTEPGDIVLYNSNNIVVFFGNNSWSYTKLGKIKEKNLNELKKLLDKNNVTLKFEYTNICTRSEIY